ncbi:putative ABC transport system permease protein [Rhizobium sp. SG_E_25_P2]|uniref:ABC transporter permease n=1 Tax=Rhizobium sp. SG_E_25_P2 TaxID=2879942 RepID=UPI00247406B3|nr:ABC transporter permease [Rhizobium sp. SG_E_25_P2]MDH6266932.1 putative ABC transport system permease protein [Rhizobium sp. SG_E_25_P2]
MIRFIFADLRRLWLGSFAIALIVALAVALGVTVTLQERALRLGSARAADKFDLVIGAAGSENQLVLSSVFLQASALPLMDGGVLQKLAKDPRVAWVAPIGFGDSYQHYPIVGSTRVLVENVAGGFAEGGNFVHEGDAVVGAAVDLPLGSTVKPTHGLAEEGGHTHTELAYTITGRLKPTGTAWDRAILVPIQAVWHIHGMGEDHDHEHAGEEPAHDHAAEEAGHEHAAEEAGHAEAAHAEGEAAADHHDDDHEHAAHADASVDESWSEEPPGLPALLVKPKTIADAYKLRQDYRQGATQAVFPAEVLTRLYATLGDAKAVLVAVAAGSQALVAAALLLVTLMHVTQRRRQIGALRAFGAPRGALFGIVWIELFGLIALGVAAGFGLGYLGAHAISARLEGESGVAMPVEFLREDFWLAAILLATSAALAAIPAVLAYRQSPAAALRG